MSIPEKFEEDKTKFDQLPVDLELSLHIFVRLEISRTREQDTKVEEEYFSRWPLSGLLESDE